MTEPLEDALRRSVRDIKFVNSTSRDNISNILVRFQKIDEAVFDKRMNRPSPGGAEHLYGSVA